MKKFPKFGAAKLSPIAGLLIAFLAITAAARAESTTLFSDDFNRSDNANVGNGWSEFSINPNGSPGSDMVSITGTQLRVAHTNNGSSRDGGIFRPFMQAGGIVVSGTVQWMNGPCAGPVVVLNAGTNGVHPLEFQIEISPSLSGSVVSVTNEEVQLARVPFTFDTSLPYQFEWSVHSDCASEVRV